MFQSTAVILKIKDLKTATATLNKEYLLVVIQNRSYLDDEVFISLSLIIQSCLSTFSDRLFNCI